MPFYQFPQRRRGMITMTHLVTYNQNLPLHETSQTFEKHSKIFLPVPKYDIVLKGEGEGRKKIFCCQSMTKGGKNPRFSNDVI